MVLELCYNKEEIRADVQAKVSKPFFTVYFERLTTSPKKHGHCPSQIEELGSRGIRSLAVAKQVS